MKLTNLQALAESSQSTPARRWFDNLEDAMNVVDKKVNGTVLKTLLANLDMPTTEADDFKAAWKKFYVAFEDLMMHTVSAEAFNNADPSEFEED